MTSDLGAAKGAPSPTVGTFVLITARRRRELFAGLLHLRTAVTGHRVTIEWMGAQIETLADLFPPTPRALCVGINPAPRSVEAGHYYQGRQGQRFFARLRGAGVIEAPRDGFGDDAAVAAGVGFTDVVKRPTPRADELSAPEKRHGVELLAEKLKKVRSPVLSTLRSGLA